jgi:dynamin 1-like protein
MDQGTNATELLKGTVYPLKLGYYAVKCRSQKNINDKVTIRDAILLEKKFFNEHPDYSSFAESMGIPFLSKSLNQILVNHIKKSLPQLNSQIKAKLADKENEMNQFIMAEVADDPLIGVDHGPLVLALINKYINAYADKLEGRSVKDAAVEVQGGSRINFIFHERFRKAINSIDPF